MSGYRYRAERLTPIGTDPCNTMAGGRSPSITWSHCVSAGVLDPLSAPNVDPGRELVASGGWPCRGASSPARTATVAAPHWSPAKSPWTAGMTLLAIPLLPTQSLTASFTMPIASTYAVNHCAEKKLRRTPWLDPGTIEMERSSQPTASATPADIDRNGRPTSIGTGGRLQAGITGRLRRNAQTYTLMGAGPCP